MESTWWREFAERKIRTTACIAENCQGTYGDVVLLLSAVISAMAAECWPGRSIDKKRYLQLLAQYAPATKMISTPRLCAFLSSQKKHDQEMRIRNQYPNIPNDGRIVLGPEIDHNEDEILRIQGLDIDLSDLRECSYAAILYRDLRTSYTHEYKIGDHTDCIRMTSSTEPCVSYTNMLGKSTRQIHFPLRLIADITKQCAISVDQLNGTLPRERPETWWIDGGNT